MAIAPVRQSNYAAQAGVSTSNAPTATINGVVAGNCLVAVVVAWRLSTSGDLVSAYGTTIGGSAANTWTLAARSARTEFGHRTEITIWVAANCSAGNTVGAPTLVHNDASTNIRQHMDEWSGIATSSPVDKTATASAATLTGTVTVGPTATLAQASQVQISAVADRYNFTWNGSSSGSGAVPSGYTLLQGTVDNSVIAAQSVYRELNSTAGVSTTWTSAAFESHGLVAATATIKVATIVRQLEITALGGATIAGTTGWEAWAWTADPKDIKATYFSGSDVIVTAGKIVLANPPASIVTNQQGQAVAQNSTLTTGLVQWTCKEV
jgi:hypothetical protein